MHPLGEGFQVRHHTVYGAIRPAALPLHHLAPQILLKSLREPRRPRHALIHPFLLDHVAHEEPEITLLHFLRTGAGRDLESEVLLDPPLKRVGERLRDADESAFTLS